MAARKLSFRAFPRQASHLKPSVADYFDAYRAWTVATHRYSDAVLAVDHAGAHARERLAGLLDTVQETYQRFLDTSLALANHDHLDR